MNQPLPQRLRFSPLLIGSFLAFAATLLPAATPVNEEFEFKGGRRIPISTVKPTADGFTATIVVGNGTQTANFAAKDVLRATFREPPGLAKARSLTASNKPAEAAAQMEKLCSELAVFQSIRGSWWHRAAILYMDALAAQGKVDQAGSFVDAATVAKLPPDASVMVADFQLILAKPIGSIEDKVSDLEALAKRSADPWMTARAWLEIGNILSSQGKVEDAVKTWLRVYLFHAAEQDLAVRGLILAARGLQQLKLAEDGLKLLDDYLSDHNETPFESALRAEMTKLDPKQQQQP